MLPSEKRVKLVSTLIFQTQSGSLNWRASKMLVGDRPGGQLYASLYEAEVDGLKFALYDWEPRFVRTSNDRQKYGVTLEVIDFSQNEIVETLNEDDDLPILKSLYQIVNRPNPRFNEKLDRFLGARP